jgi:hypothetical protein
LVEEYLGKKTNVIIKRINKDISYDKAIRKYEKDVYNKSPEYKNGFENMINVKNGKLSTKLTVIGALVDEYD